MIHLPGAPSFTVGPQQLFHEFILREGWQSWGYQRARLHLVGVAMSKFLLFLGNRLKQLLADDVLNTDKPRVRFV